MFRSWIGGEAGKKPREASHAPPPSLNPMSSFTNRKVPCVLKKNSLMGLRQQQLRVDADARQRGGKVKRTAFDSCLINIWGGIDCVSC